MAKRERNKAMNTVNSKVGDEKEKALKNVKKNIIRKVLPS